MAGIGPLTSIGQRLAKGDWAFLGAELPKNLPQHAKQEFGIGGGEIHAPNKPPNFFFGGGCRTRFCGAAKCWFLQIATGLQSVQQKCCEALEIA